MHACSVASPENALALLSDASVCTHLISENCTNFQIASAPTQEHACTKNHWWSVGHKKWLLATLTGRSASLSGRSATPISGLLLLLQKRAIEAKQSILEECVYYYTTYHFSSSKECSSWLSSHQPSVFNAWWLENQACTRSMNAQIRLKGPPPYHAWSRVSVTKKSGTFHHFEYETSHFPCVWINVRSKHMQCNTTCLSCSSFTWFILFTQFTLPISPLTD